MFFNEVENNFRKLFSLWLKLFSYFKKVNISFYKQYFQANINIGNIFLNFTSFFFFFVCTCRNVDTNFDKSRVSWKEVIILIKKLKKGRERGEARGEERVGKERGGAMKEESKN